MLHLQVFADTQVIFSKDSLESAEHPTPPRRGLLDYRGRMAEADEVYLAVDPAAGRGRTRGAQALPYRSSGSPRVCRPRWRYLTSSSKMPSGSSPLDRPPLHRHGRPRARASVRSPDAPTEPPAETPVSLLATLRETLINPAICAARSWWWRRRRIWMRHEAGIRRSRACSAGLPDRRSAAHAALLSRSQ